MADDQVKVGTEVLATHESALQDYTDNTCSGSNGENVEDKQSPVGKRKALKSDESSEGTPLHFSRNRSELGKNLDELSVFCDGIKKSPVQMKKTRSRVGNEISLRKMKSDSAAKALNERKGELRKMKSEPRKNLENGNFKNSLVLVKPKRKNKSDDDSDHKDVGRIQECKELMAVTSNEDQITNKNLEIKDVEDEKPKKVVIKEKKLLPKQIPAANIHPKAVSGNSPSKIQSLADLIMWKDVGRSTFVFGIGAFAIISSSYTNDLNISLISVLSYLGLVYLGVSFISKSIFIRESMDNINQEYVVGEEEAIWLVKLFLPYVNEFLVKLRSLFSGDPSTTMKLAVLLFIIARCGGSITIWKMTKLGFFGVFMVPKLCSSYSSHLAAYGSFWIRRFGDAWESCSHKRAVGFGMLTIVWNQSSVVGRIWGSFLLFVAFKYYHQQTHSYSSFSNFKFGIHAQTNKLIHNTN